MAQLVQSPQPLAPTLRSTLIPLPDVTPVPPVKLASLAATFEAEESGLLRYALGLVGQRAAAEDLVQEAFLRLQPLWPEIENPRAWLYRSLRNLALNHLRDHPATAELTPDTAHAPDTPPADQLGHDETLGTLRLLLSEMPPDDRALVHLKYHENLRYQEIAQRTGLTPSNVGYRLHHLLKHLADALRHAGITDSRG